MGLKAESGMASVYGASPPSNAIKVVSGVELHPGLGRMYLEEPSRKRFENPGDRPEDARRSVDNEVVIVAGAGYELRMVDGQTGTDGGEFAKIEGGAIDGYDL